MSYLSWRVENEEKYRDMVDNGEMDQMSAFEISSKSDLSDTIVGPIAQEMANRKDMTPIHFAGIFAQYLYETYHISPVDVELFAQYLIYATLVQTSNSAATAAKMITEILLRSGEEDE